MTETCIVATFYNTRMTSKNPDALNKDYNMVINGELVEGDADTRINVEYPYDNVTWATVPNANKTDVDFAVSAAKQTFESEKWRSLTPTKRGELLINFADVVEGDIENLCRLETLGNGKPIPETTGLVRSFCKRARYYAGLADKVGGQTLPVDEKDMFVFTQKEPYGVIAAITPYNSPISIAGFKICPALAAGNTVVLKPSELAPVSSIRLGELALKAGWPPGALNVITGQGETGEALTRHENIRLITFTGGIDTGQKVGEVAGRKVNPVKLELGGKSPNLIFSDANLQRAVIGTMRGIFTSAGQSCVASSRLLLHEDIHEEFVDLLVEKTKQLTLGDPLDSETDIGPVISSNQVRKIQSYVEEAIQDGAKLVCGGNPREDLPGRCFYPPTILTNVTQSMTIAHEEVFGPVLSIFSFLNEDEAIEMANDTCLGLAAAVWTTDLSRAIRMSEQLEAGNVWVNTYRKLSPAAPFGGYKKSGIGRENGTTGIDEFLQTKSIWIDKSDEPIEVNYP